MIRCSAVTILSNPIGSNQSIGHISDRLHPPGRGPRLPLNPFCSVGRSCKIGSVYENSGLNSSCLGLGILGIFHVCLSITTLF